MRTQLISGGSVLLAALLASSASAQQTARVAPIPGPVKNAGTYHVATGEWTRAQQTYGILAQDALYRNDLASGYFGLLDQSEIANDEGRLPGAGEVLLPGGAEVGTADCYTITGFQFGYCNLAATAVTYTLTFRDAYAPCNNPANFSDTATFVASGIPTNGCWIVAFDISGTSLEFGINADGGDGIWNNDNDADDFGYALNINGGQGDNTGQTQTGPILGGRTDLPLTQGDGTKFKNTANDGTGLGSEDLFWLNSPTVADGCYFYGGCNPCANFNTTFFGIDGCTGGVPTFCDPAAANSVSAGGGVLASTGGYGTNMADFSVTDIPNQPGVLFTGPAMQDPGVPFGCFQRCVVGAGVVRYGPFFPAGNALNVTIDMSVSSNSFTQYWYRDPAGIACGASFNLSNGVGQ
jgi:hypothetical protein